MVNINEILVGGNLTRDPNLRMVGEKKFPVVSFNIAVNDRVMKAGGLVEETEFFIVEAVGDMAKEIANFKKGQPIVVIGKMKNEKWTDKEGVEKSVFKVKVERFGANLSEILRSEAPLTQAEKSGKTNGHAKTEKVQNVEAVEESTDQVPF